MKQLNDDTNWANGDFDFGFNKAPDSNENQKWQVNDLIQTKRFVVVPKSKKAKAQLALFARFLDRFLGYLAVFERFRRRLFRLWNRFVRAVRQLLLWLRRKWGSFFVSVTKSPLLWMWILLTLLRILLLPVVTIMRFLQTLNEEAFSRWQLFLLQKGFSETHRELKGVVNVLLSRRIEPRTSELLDMILSLIEIVEFVQYELNFWQIVLDEVRPLVFLKKNSWRWHLLLTTWPAHCHEAMEKFHRQEKEIRPVHNFIVESLPKVIRFIRDNLL